MDIRCVDMESGRKTTTHIIDIWESGVKLVYEVKSGGDSIKASADHLFLTQRGWVKLKDIDVSSDFVIKANHTGNGETPKNYLCFNRAQRPILLKEQENLCADCGCEIDSTCDVHHIEPVSVRPDLAFEKSNIVALCQRCHTDRHIEIRKSTVSPKLYKIDSIAQVGEEMTYDLQVEHVDSNFVANGFVLHNCEKHRMLSSNSSSSRAIPLSKVAQQVREDPYVPFDVRKAQRGMQGDERLTNEALQRFQTAWRGRAMHTAMYAQNMLDAYGVHKQHLNRLLEPFAWQHKVITATEWDNFFALRLADNAQPDIRIAAECMRDAIDNAKCIECGEDDWHIPFERDEDRELSLYERLSISAARCARISYVNHGRTDISYEKDMELAELLMNEWHASAFEHQAKPLTRYEERSHTDTHGALWSGNFRGWVQYRKLLENNA